MTLYRRLSICQEASLLFLLIVRAASARGGTHRDRNNRVLGQFFAAEIQTRFFLSNIYLLVRTSSRSMYSSNTANASSIGCVDVISTPAILNKSIGDFDEPALRKLM